jgi:hypothetical protein
VSRITERRSESKQFNAWSVRHPTELATVVIGLLHYASGTPARHPATHASYRTKAALAPDEKLVLVARVAPSAGRSLQRGHLHSREIRQQHTDRNLAGPAKRRKTLTAHARRLPAENLLAAK